MDESFKLLESKEINDKLTVNVYTCEELGDRVFGLQHSFFEEEMLITETTLAKVAKAVNLRLSKTKTASENESSLETQA